MDLGAQEQVVDDLEYEAKYKIISLVDEDSSDKKKILDDAKDEISRLYRELREWLSNNINSDETNERIERLKQETTNLINRTRIAVQTFNDRDNVKASKAKAKELSNKVLETVNDGFVEVMHNEHVSKIIDGVSDTIENVVSDERIVTGVKKLKKGTLKVAESALNGLKRVLDTDDDQFNDQKG